MKTDRNSISSIKWINGVRLSIDLYIKYQRNWVTNK